MEHPKTYQFVFISGLQAPGVNKLEASTRLALHSIHHEALNHARTLDDNGDETGWKEGSKKAWLWAAVTRRVKIFLVRGHRDRRAFHDLVGPTPGVLTTDRYCHAVCGRKTSGGTDSEQGRRFVKRILTVVASSRSQGRDLIESLAQAIAAHQNHSQKPILLNDGA